jgi:signal transduction histidine kinase
MSIAELKTALRNSGRDDALSRQFVALWPRIEAMLTAFATATRLPIFVYLDNAKILNSPIHEMPDFCQFLLNSTELSQVCIDDASARAMSQAAGSQGDTQYCHAGFANRRHQIDTGCVGTLTIFFGARRDDSATATEKMNHAIATLAPDDLPVAQRLRAISALTPTSGPIETSDVMLMDAIVDILRKLLSSTLEASALSINMAHELCQTLLGLGLIAKEITQLPEDGTSPQAAHSRALHRRALHECQLGLYVVRNFLSHFSEERYKDVERPRFATVDMAALLEEMVDLHRDLALEDKQVILDLEIPDQLPVIRGVDMELRRLMHNVLSNAIKYSYHKSAHASDRLIRIRTKIPYDPGFKSRRFAITFENYGLGLSGDELPHVFRPGFRGYQARKEQPIGSGIGLSEARKIMALHNGEIKLRSSVLHKGSSGTTFLTRVELIFPYD